MRFVTKLGQKYCLAYVDVKSGLNLNHKCLKKCLAKYLDLQELDYVSNSENYSTRNYITYTAYFVFSNSMKTKSGMLRWAWRNMG